MPGSGESKKPGPKLGCRVIYEEEDDDDDEEEEEEKKASYTNLNVL